MLMLAYITCVTYILKLYRIYNGISGGLVESSY